MTDYASRPHPSELTYAEAWTEYQENGEAWREAHRAAVEANRAAGLVGFAAVTAAGPAVRDLPVSQRQEALGRWHEFFESDEQSNQAFGYPEGHPKAQA